MNTACGSWVDDGVNNMRAVFKVLLLSLPTIALAQDHLTANRLLDMYNNATGNGRQEVQRHVETFEQGVSAANSYNNAEGRNDAVLYCVPRNIVLKGDQLMDILRRQVEADPDSLGTTVWQIALIEALREEFPCKP